MHRLASIAVPRPSRRAAAVASCLALLALASCRSPNRGVWRGTFDGSVSGTVEFRISTSGRSLDGTMDGKTRDGQPFHAEMEGKTRDRYFHATFEGTSRTEMYPVKFEGFMTGELVEGHGTGDWECQLALGASPKLKGTWSVDQQPAE